ncbi:MAG: Ig-like domain-containing protein [Prevotella sp.]|nr:Ig-like domain-containing protein [Prevotella sp.]
MTKKIRTITLLFLALLGMALDVTAADFKDFSVQVNNQSGTLLTSEEQVQGTSVNFGVAVADNGTVSRVAADDASAVATISGTYHSDHGCTGLQVVVAVPGSVKITVGQCTYSTSTIKVTNSSGETVASKTPSSPACWKNSHSNVDELYYSGDATTLTITGMGYCPYVAVEAVNATPTKYTVTYALGSETAEGVLPASSEIDAGESVAIPLNRTLYKDGYTLTGWTDGTNTHAPGATVTPEGDLALTPVFTQNSVALADRTSDVTLKWDFQKRNGAPVLNYQNQAGIYVTQGNVNGSTIDVKLDFTTSPGKINNTSWNDWCQINQGTTFTIPSCKGAVVSVEAYAALSELTIDGQNDYTSGKTISYTVANSADAIDIVFGSEGQYYRYIQTVLPVVASQGGGDSFDNVNGTITWPVGNEATPDIATDIAGAISSASVSVGEGLTVGSATYFDTPMVMYTPANSNAGTVSAAMIEYRVKAAKGVTFKPTNVTYAAVKVGTDNATYSWSYTLDGVESTITKIDPKPDLLRNSGSNSNTAKLYHSHDISADGVQEFTFRIYISDCANNKQICIGNMVITGTVNGTTQAVETFPLTIAASPEAGGTVSAYPNDEAYEAGSEVTLTATPNFGYHFINWTNGDNEVVSTNAKFTYTVNAASALTANFQAVNTYALNLTVDGSNDYMVTLDPAPTMVDDKMMYEEDTYVTLTANQYEGLVTFSNWSDGQTSQEIRVKMTENIDLTAYYTQNDIIAGWDFYTRGNSGRVADFSSEDNETTAFTLTNGTETTSWLDKSTEAAGGYESMKGAAVNWKTGNTEGDVGHYYWQTKVNAEAFTDIKVQFDMLYNYNSYTVYNVDYSTDGENWTTNGSISLTGAKAVCHYEGTLPANANYESALYIRMIPDYTSAIQGSSSKNDGNTIAMVFITGTEQLEDDETAPVLVSTVPEEGADNASANGKVVLTFDEKVKLADGATATLNGKALTGTASGKTVVFEYKGLEYSTAYTFTLPANSVSDLTDNYLAEPVTINFSTRTLPDITKGLYDYYVKSNDDLVAAINAANSRSDKTTRYRIFIHNGTYTLPQSTTATINSDDGNTYPSPVTFITASNISFIGESMEGVVITNTIPASATYAGTYGTTSVYDGISKSDVLQLQGSVRNTYFQDLTVKSGMADARGRNIAVQDRGSNTIYKNTCLWGYQDTWTSNNNNGLYYFENGLVRGRTDFLCGKGDAYFNQVDIQMCMNTGGYIAVPSNSIKYGYVFKDCTIKGENSALNGKYTLGRPWGDGTPVALWIDTKMEIVPSAIGWSEMSNGWPKRFAEYNSTTASGQPVDLSGRKTIFGDNHPNNPVLTAEEAAEAADMTNMYGEWDPTSYTEQANAPSNVKLTDGILTWDDSNHVFCWAIVKDGSVVDFTTNPVYEVDDAEATYAVRAANEMGGLGEATTAVVSTGWLPGDVNHDGEVNITDVTLTVNYLLGNEDNNFYLTEADANSDEQVNITDVTTIVNYVLTHAQQ